MTNTTIEWTDETWNPVTGCSKVSPGCANCYAERIALRRFQPYDTGLPWTAQNAEKNVYLHADRLEQPLRWKKPRRVFVNSMSDLFHEQVPDEFIDRVLAVMAISPEHTFQILTKRPDRMREYLMELRADDQWFGRLHVNAAPHLGDVDERWEAFLGNAEWPLRNVWLGVSVEDQNRADERIPGLLATPAVVRFVSAEPLLGSIDLSRVKFHHGFVEVHGGELPALDWLIVGGESGPGARPMHPDWVRSMRDQCVEAGVPFFFKQWGEWAPATAEYGVSGSVMPESGDRFTWIGWEGTTQNPSSHGLADPIMAIARVGKKAAGRELDGREWNEFPEVR